MPVIERHKQGENERRDERERATCATCGWHGPWRKLRSGWPYRDHYHHAAQMHDRDMNQVWEMLDAR